MPNQTKVGDIVLYQPSRARGGGPQMPAIVAEVDNEADKSPASLVLFSAAGSIDRVGATYGEDDGQYMKTGEESKTAKSLKQAKEDKKKADEARAKADVEEAKKMREEMKKQKAEATLDPQQMAQFQYRNPQPPPQ